MVRQGAMTGRPRMVLWLFIGLVAILLPLGLWLGLRSHDAPPAARVRQYGSFTSCLLTDERGIGGEPAALVWAGMQDASQATLSKVQYLAIVGPQTADNAATFAASLVQGRCDIIIGAGETAGKAIRAAASTSPKTQFIVVGPGSSGGNVRVVEGTGPALRAQIAADVTASAKA